MYIAVLKIAVHLLSNHLLGIHSFLMTSEQIRYWNYGSKSSNATLVYGYTYACGVGDVACYKSAKLHT